MIMKNISISKSKSKKIKKPNNPKIKKQKLKTTNPSDTIGNYVTLNSSKEVYYEDTDDTIKKCYESCKYYYGKPNIETGEMNYKLCIDNYYFIRNTTNCIIKVKLLQWIIFLF